jgi:hypothetical protein
MYVTSVYFDLKNTKTKLKLKTHDKRPWRLAATYPSVYSMTVNASGDT